YFFRSNFDFTVDVSSADPGKRLLTVSIPPVLTAETMDGTFTLYAEDKEGVRSAVAGGALTTALFRGGFAQAVFAPASGVRAHVLGAGGTVAVEGGAVHARVEAMGMHVAAVQTAAEITGEEARRTVSEIHDASTLAVMEQRSRNPRQQRA